MSPKGIRPGITLSVSPRLSALRAITLSVSPRLSALRAKTACEPKRHTPRYYSKRQSKNFRSTSHYSETSQQSFSALPAISNDGISRNRFRSIARHQISKTAYEPKRHTPRYCSKHRSKIRCSTSHSNHRSKIFCSTSHYSKRRSKIFRSTSHYS